MKIISTYKQEQSMVHLIKIMEALLSDNDIRRLNAIENVADIAYIIGGVKMMAKIRNMVWKSGKEKEHE